MKVNETQIEKFIRFPNQLEESERVQIQKLLETNVEAKKLADFFLEFYKELDVLQRPSSIQLHHYKSKSEVYTPFVLAADSSDGSPESLVTTATFASEETGTVVRVLEEKAKKKYQVHVLSKYLKGDERVIVSFNNLAHDFITERGGFIKNISSSYFGGTDWATQTLIVSFPRSSCTYHPQTGNDVLTICDDCTLSRENGDFRIQSTDFKIRKVLIEHPNRAELLAMDRDSLSFQADHQQKFTLYLYG
jgi:hypothetical protein